MERTDLNLKLPKRKVNREAAQPQMSNQQKAMAANQVAQAMIGAQGGGQSQEGNGSIASSAMSGAATGFAVGGGPHGAAIGAGAGTLAGIMGSRAARKQRRRQAQAQKYSNIAQIESNLGTQQTNVLANLMAGLGSRR